MVPILLIRASFGSDETGSSLLKGLAKRSQHFNTTTCNIVGHNMLHTFGHPVAICCNMLDDVVSNLKTVNVVLVWPGSRNIVAVGHAR